jgi:hypothetical protein
MTDAFLNHLKMYHVSMKYILGTKFYVSDESTLN